MKKAIIYVGSFFIALTLLLAVVALFAPRLGWRVDTVLSGSMSPAMGIGSAAVTQSVPPSTIQVGDIITYRSPRSGKLTTHRVIDKRIEDTLVFQTKGDANENHDFYTVPAADIEGKVVLTVPLLGYATGFVRTPLGFGLMLGLPGMLIIGLEMRMIWVWLDEDEKRKKASKRKGIAAKARGQHTSSPPVVAMEGEK